MAHFVALATDYHRLGVRGDVMNMRISVVFSVRFFVLESFGWHYFAPGTPGVIFDSPRTFSMSTPRVAKYRLNAGPRIRYRP